MRSDEQDHRASFSYRVTVIGVGVFARIISHKTASALQQALLTVTASYTATKPLLYYYSYFTLIMTLGLFLRQTRASPSNLQCLQSIMTAIFMLTSLFR